MTHGKDEGREDELQPKGWCGETETTEWDERVPSGEVEEQTDPRAEETSWPKSLGNRGDLEASGIVVGLRTKHHKWACERGTEQAAKTSTHVAEKTHEEGGELLNVNELPHRKLDRE